MTARKAFDPTAVASTFPDREEFASEAAYP